MAACFNYVEGEMRNSTFAVFSRGASLALTAAFVFSMPALAQRPPIRRVLVTTVKPDRIDDFEAAIKQYNEAYAKITGGRSRTMFQSLTGQNQYMLVRDYEKWADLDPGAVTRALAADSQTARINQRIMSCVESSTMLVEGLLPELSMATRPAESPKIIRLAHSRVRADKTAEWEAIVKNELLPAYKKARQKSVTVRKVRFGGTTNDYYISTRMDAWADVETDSLSKSMGAEPYNAMVARLTAVTEERDVNLFRFRADLTYTAPATASATSAAAR